MKHALRRKEESCSNGKGLPMIHGIDELCDERRAMHGKARNATGGEAAPGLPAQVRLAPFCMYSRLSHLRPQWGRLN